MDLKDIDQLIEAGFRVEMGSRLQKLEAGVSALGGDIHQIRVAENQQALVKESLESRLRTVEAGLLGLKDRFSRWERFVDSGTSRIEALESKLKEHTPFDPPLSGCRETAWVVKTVHGHGPCGLARSPGAFVWEASFTGNGADQILRFTARSDAETLARLLGIGEPALVYTDTMEEVGR